jgi:glycosyltransferase involved in cell wall biosynthesis
MKILQINKFFYRRGGAEAYMLDLSAYLRAQGHEVIEFSMQHPNNLASPYSHYFIKNIDLSKREGFFKDIFKAGHLLYSRAAAKNLEALIKAEKPDIAHLHNFYFQLTPSILRILKKYRIPMVWTMHDYKLICPNYKLFTQGQVCERCKQYKYYNCFKFKCLKNNRAFSLLATLESYLHNWFLKSYGLIDLYISPSKFLQAKVSQWGIEPAKVKQLYNFINLADFKPAEEVGDGLLYFGRLAEEKGLMTLLVAAKELPEIKLTIVGTGPLKKQIEQYSQDNKLANVKLIGHTTGQPLYDLIKQARLVILPSIWYENNPISVLEAMALAKPVIGSNLGGIPELVLDKQTGWLFQPGQTADLVRIIKTNYSQIEQLKLMGLAGRGFVEKHCQAQSHYQQLMLIYRQLLNSAQ